MNVLANEMKRDHKMQIHEIQNSSVVFTRNHYGAVTLTSFSEQDMRAITDKLKIPRNQIHSDAADRNKFVVKIFGARRENVWFNLRLMKKRDQPSESN